MLKRISTLAAALAAAAAWAAPAIPELTDAVKLPDFTIVNSGEEKSFKLPELPGKPGMVTVLRCRMSTPGDSGCNNAARIMFNDTPLGMLTASGRPRLLFRALTFQLHEKQWQGRVFKTFNGSSIILPFAKDCDDADRRTVDGLGSWYVFDLTDAAHPVDVNTVTFRNIRVYLGSDITLTVKDASVGYLPRTALPKTEVKTLAVSGKPALSLQNSAAAIHLYRNGGFTAEFPGVKPFIVETALGMRLGTPTVLNVQDKAPAQPTSFRKLDANTVVLTSRFPQIQLDRTLRLLPDGRIDWFEKWTNLDKTAIRAIPFRYRTGLAATPTVNWLGGSRERLEQNGFGNNSTVFYETVDGSGAGCGFSCEDDYSMLVADAVSNDGVIELFSRVLALAPGKSITFHYQIAGVADGGYWRYINAMRNWRGVGKLGIERPFFFASVIPAIPGLNWDQRIQKNLGSLGKITVAITPWFGQLGRRIMSKREPGPVNEQHEAARLADRKLIADKLAQYKRLLPEAKIMLLHHPSMQTTYMPEFERNPLAATAIRNADGTPYHHNGYDEIILKEKRHQGWSIIYYLPTPGSPWYNQIMDDVDYGLSQGADGFYFDEYSFETPRDYRRYDYSSWDGFSADIDENGKVVALKSDNARTTDLFKSALQQKLASRGKLFLGNGGDCTCTINCTAGYGFTEGTALINIPAMHLDNVPLVLGNYGTEGTRPGVMKAVREALQAGGLYSPNVLTNQVIEGRDNFICKMYPLTVTEIGPGFIRGCERIITGKSGTFAWPETADGTAELFTYNADGDRIDHGKTAKIVNGKITLTVPDHGLVIAEKINALK